MGLLKQAWRFKSFLHAQVFKKNVCVSIKETLRLIRKRPYKRDASRYTLKGNQERARKVRNVKMCLLKFLQARKG